MKITVFVLLVAFVLGGCGGSDMLGAAGKMITPLASSLGISPETAMAGAGALLGLAKEKLPAGDWSKVAGVIPGTDAMLKAATDTGALPAPIGDMAGLSGTMSKLGLSTDQAGKIATGITDYATKAGASDVASMLGNVWK